MAERCTTPIEGCRHLSNGTCHISRHHLLFPKIDYQTPLEKLYRDLPENIEVLPRCEHDQVHLEEPIPEKPPGQTMRHAVAQAFGRGAIYLSVNNQKAIE